MTRLDDLELHDSEKRPHWDDFLQLQQPSGPDYDSLGWCYDIHALAGPLVL